MKFSNVIFCLIIIVCSILNVGTDFEEYQDLGRKDVQVIKKEDLPVEFGKKAYEVIVDFIQKTHGLKHEWVLFFDYIDGVILKCVKGKEKNVNVNFEEGEFEGFHVASIHNHTDEVYSPPSDKNFGIFMRNFEDYELIACSNELWILKAKCFNPSLNMILKISSEMILESCQEYCDKLYDDEEKANKVCDIMYGRTLSNFINDKNIKDIQLTKKEYQS